MGSIIQIGKRLLSVVGTAFLMILSFVAAILSGVEWVIFGKVRLNYRISNKIDYLWSDEYLNN